MSYKSFNEVLTIKIRYYIGRVLSLYPKSNIMSTKEIISTDLRKEISKIVSDKVDTFLMTCLDDCQDEMTEGFELVLDFEQGILPPRYVEIRKELESMFTEYLIQNVMIDELQEG